MPHSTNLNLIAMTTPESDNVETATALSVGVADEQLSSRIEFSAEDFLPLFPDEGRGSPYSYALTPEACKSKLQCERTTRHCCFLSHPDDGPLKAYVVTYDWGTKRFKCAYQGQSSVLVRPGADRDFLVQSGAFQRGFLYHLNEGGEIDKQPEKNTLLWTLPIRRGETCLEGRHNVPVSVAGPVYDDTLKIACTQSSGRYNYSGYRLVSWRADRTATPPEMPNRALFYRNCEESIVLKEEWVPIIFSYRWEPRRKEAWCSMESPDHGVESEDHGVESEDHGSESEDERVWSKWSPQQSTRDLRLTWPGPTTQTLNHS